MIRVLNSGQQTSVVRQQAFMSWERFKLRTPMFAWPKTVHTLNHTTARIGSFQCALHEVG
jgi:hypothetical protein